MWGLFPGANPLGILEVLGGEPFLNSGLGLGLCPRDRKVKWSTATGDKKGNEFSVLVTFLDAVGLQA